MAHPFQDKLFVFIGTPVRCKRQIARDALVVVGGVPDERVTAFTDYVVALNRAEDTKAYQKALEYDSAGSLIILSEEQFFDILEGKASPPEKKKPDRKIIVIPCTNHEAEARESERIRENILHRKRLNNMARHGVPMLGTRAKIDLRTLDTANRIMRILDEQN